MTDSEIDRIIKEKKRKYLPTLSNQIFHSGVIILVSLAIGMLYFQLAPISPDVKAEDVGWVRQSFGLWLGLIIAASGSMLYLIWTFWRAYRAKKEAEAEIFASALKDLKKK